MSARAETSMALGFKHRLLGFIFIFLVCWLKTKIAVWQRRMVASLIMPFTCLGTSRHPLTSAPWKCQEASEAFPANAQVSFHFSNFNHHVHKQCGEAQLWYLWLGEQSSRREAKITALMNKCFLDISAIHIHVPGFSYKPNVWGD